MRYIYIFTALISFISCQKKTKEAIKENKIVQNIVKDSVDKVEIIFDFNSSFKKLNKKAYKEVNEEQIIPNLFDRRLEVCNDSILDIEENSSFEVITDKYNIKFNSIENDDEIFVYNLLFYDKKNENYYISIQTIDRILSLIIFKDNSYFLQEGDLIINKNNGDFLLYGNTSNNSFINTYSINKTKVMNIRKIKFNEIAISNVCLYKSKPRWRGYVS